MIRRADFRPAWWLPGPHLQTVWPTLCRWGLRPQIRRERLELPDGDFLDVDWTLGRMGPIVLILHGLEGSSDSVYARGLLTTLTQLGWRGAVMHFRGCSGEPNRRRQSYNAGDTRDLDYVATLLHQREPDTPLACVGFSLGANVMLKWLGETGAAAPVQSAVGVSVPFQLEAAARRLQLGFSRLYQAYLLHSLRTSYRRKFRNLPQPPVPLEQIGKLKNFFSYDDRITAPLHGYSGVADYYARASCRQYLSGIQVPTLILHARDDPFILPTAIPAPTELSERIILELSPQGGHVGFVSGSVPWQPIYWLEKRIPAFLAEFLEPSYSSSDGEEAMPLEPPCPE